MMVREFIDFAAKIAPLLNECFGKEQKAAACSR
jgi:hypothetical protein